MKRYSVDIGCWESGRSVTIEAETPQEAYKKADALCKRNEGDIEDDGEYVVQIFELHPNSDKTADAKCRYDFMNGFDMYDEIHSEEG